MARIIFLLVSVNLEVWFCHSSHEEGELSFQSLSVQISHAVSFAQDVAEEMVCQFCTYASKVFWTLAFWTLTPLTAVWTSQGWANGGWWTTEKGPSLTAHPSQGHPGSASHLPACQLTSDTRTRPSLCPLILDHRIRTIQLILTLESDNIALKPPSFGVEGGRRKVKGKKRKRIRHEGLSCINGQRFVV